MTWVVHRFVRYQLRIRDVDVVWVFYTDVFGSALWGVGVAVVSLSERAVVWGALVHWLGHIGVFDVEATVVWIVVQGGQSLGFTQRGSDGSLLASLRDLFGSVMVVGSETAVAGDDRLLVVWYTLYTVDHERAFAWYVALFGWAAHELVDLGFELGQHQLFVWETSGFSVGSVANTVRSPHVHTHWLFQFAVDDLEQTLRWVRVGGGKALLVMKTLIVDLVAVCDDPQGVVFAYTASLRDEKLKSWVRIAGITLLSMVIGALIAFRFFSTLVGFSLKWKLFIGVMISFLSISHTSSRVSLVSWMLCGFTVRMYQKRVISSSREQSAISFFSVSLFFSMISDSLSGWGGLSVFSVQQRFIDSFFSMFLSIQVSAWVGSRSLDQGDLGSRASKGSVRRVTASLNSFSFTRLFLFGFEKQLRPSSAVRVFSAPGSVAIRSVTVCGFSSTVQWLGCRLRGLIEDSVFLVVSVVSFLGWNEASRGSLRLFQSDLVPSGVRMVVEYSALVEGKKPKFPFLLVIVVYVAFVSKNLEVARSLLWATFSAAFTFVWWVVAFALAVCSWNAVANGAYFWALSSSTHFGSLGDSAISFSLAATARCKTFGVVSLTLALPERWLLWLVMFTCRFSVASAVVTSLAAKWVYDEWLSSRVNSHSGAFEQDRIWLVSFCACFSVQDMVAFWYLLLSSRVRLLRSRLADQSVFSTFICRNRAGGQPWLMAFICLGCFLSSAFSFTFCQVSGSFSSSQFAQKFGVRLWQVTFVTMFCTLPSLISQNVLFLNWKLQRC